MQGGDFIEFTMASGFCLNPFSMIDATRVAQDEDYKLDCMAMLKAIVNQMSRHIDRLTDTERGLIDGAVNRVWEAKGRNGSIDDVIAALNETGNELASHLAIAMMPPVLTLMATTAPASASRPFMAGAVALSNLIRASSASCATRCTFCLMVS